ncbi:S-adenosyl-L-methionine-dependent methyltransferase [Hyaloraphidium curvatum]|nr:S-adenosyl-L-methionine-dependent methyltransferase [Hyaloraphidium curvatum]
MKRRREEQPATPNLGGFVSSRSLLAPRVSRSAPPDRPEKKSRADEGASAHSARGPTTAFVLPSIQVAGAFAHASRAKAAVVGEAVVFRRQRDNPHDANAIAIARALDVDHGLAGGASTESETERNQLGFVPRPLAHHLGPLLDLGVVSFVKGSVVIAANAKFHMRVSIDLSIASDHFDVVADKLEPFLKTAPPPAVLSPPSVTIEPPQIPNGFASESFEGISLLSLFTGIGGDRVGLERAGIKVGRMFSCEIDQGCVQVLDKNHDNVIHLGGVENVTEELLSKLGPIDVVVAGFPCQDLSKAKGPDRLGLKGSRSGLFFHIPRILTLVRKLNSRNGDGKVGYVVENVYGMPANDLEIISKELGVYPVRYQADRVSGCRRDRVYWTCFAVKPLQRAVPDPTMLDALMSGKPLESWRKKALCIVRSTHGSLVYDPDMVLQPYRKSPHPDPCVRPLHPVEEERLLGFPDNYTLIGTEDQDSNLTRHQQLGNSYSCQVIEHIVREMAIEGWRSRLRTCGADSMPFCEGCSSVICICEECG